MNVVGWAGVTEPVPTQPSLKPTHRLLMIVGLNQSAINRIFIDDFPIIFCAGIDRFWKLVDYCFDL